MYIGDSIPATAFCSVLQTNVDNVALTDEAFRQLVRNTLPIVEFKRPEKPVVEEPMPDWSALKGYLPTKPIDVVVFSRREDKHTNGFFVKQHHIDARKPVGTRGKYHGPIPGGGGDLWWVLHEDGSIGVYCYLTELAPA